MTSLILDAGVIPPGSPAYPYFVAVQNGFTSALCTCLLINGFVGFQLYEDGTRQSVWLIRGCSAGMFVISGAVSILTFNDKAGLSPTNTVGMFVVLYILNGICLLIYVIMQFILVVNTLQDRWPLGDLAFGTFFFVIGQVILYVFSKTICEGVQHYLDGLFFTTICNLLAVMMVYKVWFIISIVQWCVKLIVCSIGTQSRKRISNSVLVPSKATGRLRNFSQRKIVVEQYITTDQRTAVYTILRPHENHTMVATISWSRSILPSRAVYISIMRQAFRALAIRRWVGVLTASNACISGGTWS